MSRQTRRRGPRNVTVIDATSTDARPLTFAERSRLHQRYARLTGRSVNLGYTSLGIVVTAATPAELVAATDAVVAEATRKQPLLRDRLDYRSINSLG